MKVALIRKKYTFHGGAEGFSETFAKKLAEDGHEVHIFATEWQINTVHNNICFHRVPSLTVNSFLRDITFAISAFFMLKKQRKYFDVIQSHDKTIYQDIYRAGDGCHIEWLKQRWRRIGLLGKLSIILNPYHWLILDLEHNIFRRHRYKKIVAISEMVKRNIVENYRVLPDDIEVIYNGVDTERFSPYNKVKYSDEIRQKHGITDNDFVVLFVGSGFERKGVRFLIEAVESISVPVTVMIVGKGSEKRLKGERKIKKFPLPNGERVRVRGYFHNKQNIIFCGPQKEIHKYYAVADVFVFPSIYEPFGNVHLEALASGLPVITTKQSGASEIIEGGRQGFVIENPEDTEKMAEKIKLLMNPEIRRDMGVEARRLAERFSFDAHIKELMALYQSLMK